MESLEHDYFFWRLIHHYVLEKGFRVLDKREQEFLLEDEEAKPRKVLRIIRTDIEFASWLRRDAVESVKQFERVRRHLRVRKLIGENLYISMNPPVDSFEDVTKPYFESHKKRTTVYTAVLDRRNTERMKLPDAPSIETVEELESAIFHLKQQITQITNAHEEKEKSLFLHGKPIATVILLCCIAAMFSVVEKNGGSTSVLTLIEFGAKYNPLIIAGEWWRLLSAMFLHITFLHLFMNSIALFYLGGAVERMYGTSRFLIIYFLAGLTGSIASFAFNEQVAAGASGAIFGCFGALLYFGTIYKKLFFRTMGKSVLTILAINLVFGFVVPMVDNGAHIGGLLGGFLACAIVHLPKHKTTYKQPLVAIIMILLLFGLFRFGINNEQKVSSPMVELQIGQEYLQQDELEKAYPFLKRAVEEGLDIPEATFLLAYAEAKFENYEVARELLLETIEKRYEFHEAHYNLALIYLELDQIEEARASVNRAIDLSPDDTYLDLQERIQH
ncbi:rhomboid family intramembrane serine protease [Halalkalibacter kiskunsagensis]|uniref:Rhomboid family intramembrane serine protease n=1 Tax=Halalkalibacter kiskunsagensis TaxID=1548599 RepID=A0ABV6KJM0_9BACI